MISQQELQIAAWRAAVMSAFIQGRQPMPHLDVPAVNLDWARRYVHMERPGEWTVRLVLGGRGFTIVPLPQLRTGGFDAAGASHLWFGRVYGPGNRLHTSNRAVSVETQTWTCMAVTPAMFDGNSPDAARNAIYDTIADWRTRVIAIER